MSTAMQRLRRSSTLFKKRWNKFLLPVLLWFTPLSLFQKPTKWVRANDFKRKKLDRDLFWRIKTRKTSETFEKVLISPLFPINCSSTVVPKIKKKWKTRGLIENRSTKSITPSPVPSQIFEVLIKSIIERSSIFEKKVGRSELELERKKNSRDIWLKNISFFVQNAHRLQ